jgi:hypothetical protein
VKSASDNWLMPGVTAVALGVVLTTLYFLPPDQAGIYPICVFHRFTGWQCPGCGGLRATHQLLHGNMVEAFRLNALFVVLLVCAPLFVAAYLAPDETVRHRLKPLRHRLWKWLLLGAAVFFGVTRNL